MIKKLLTENPNRLTFIFCKNRIFFLQKINVKSTLELYFYNIMNKIKITS